ncbi:hypothetical protein Droror1_Dr00020161 [Drosera rotundifolia]
MWLSKENGDKKEGTNALVAVAIDKDKGSQQALKWAFDNLLQKGQTVVLIHVKLRPPGLFLSSTSLPLPNSRQLDTQARDLFLPFRCLCTRKDVCISIQVSWTNDNDLGKETHIFLFMILDVLTLGF